MADDVPRAEATLRDAFSFVEQSGEQEFWLGELLRLDGRIALKRTEPDPSRAEACFVKAIDVAPEPGGAANRTARCDGSCTTSGGMRARPRKFAVCWSPILATIGDGEGLKVVHEARVLLSTLAE